MAHRIINIIGVALLATACSNDVLQTSFLDGTEPAPLNATAVIDATRPPLTRAADKEFDTGDVLLSYVRHVTWNGTNAGARTSVDADQAPRLVSFTTDGNMTAWDKPDITPIGTGTALGLTSTNTNQSATLTPDAPLFWDDFSNSIDAAHDLRTDGHYLESFYGYCYNGGSPSTPLTKTDGTLGWTVATDQDVTDALLHSDLLWSAEQPPIRYTHDPSTRPTLVLPYTHALSKVTIEVVCEDGFEADATKNFGSAVVTLKQMNSTTSLTAPTATIATGSTPADIKMQQLTAQDKRCSFVALVAPTVFKDGQELASLKGFDGNDYKLVLSDAIIDAKEGEPAATKADAWSTQLAAHDATTIEPKDAAAYDATDGGLCRPGINYLITVTLRKQEVSVNAAIRDWDEVSATGAGIIQFAGDITEKTGSIATNLQTDGFDLYRAKEAATPVYGTAATTYVYTDDPAGWTRTNEIYWPNGTDKYYFRALSGATPDDAATTGTNESLTMTSGHDVLWGTTSAHTDTAADGSDYNYAKGDPLAPRTGDVPLTFSHPMAKITVKLLDENKDTALPAGVEATDYDNPLNPRINLEGASVQIVNISASGTINLHDGNIAPADYTSGQRLLSEDTSLDPKRMGYYAAYENGAATTYSADITLRDYSVIPQTIGDDALLIVTLADGTTYRAQLNTCTVTATASATAILHPIDDAIKNWYRGVAYTYTISLSKEKMTFRALIENWNTVDGGGKATLEWD